MGREYKIDNLENEIRIVERCLEETNQIEVRRHLEVRLGEKMLEYEERTGTKYDSESNRSLL